MKIKKSVYLCYLLFLICSCSEVPGKLLIMEANSLNARGMYNEAISSYLKALGYAEAEPFGEFGLGSVFFALGEEQAALDRFERAMHILETNPSAAGGRELRYRIHYNTGVVLFSAGDFSGAADSFRAALRADGSRVEAKRNLELSLRSLARDTQSTGGDRGDIEHESRAAFFEFVRQRELNQWRLRIWPEEEEVSGPDY